MMCDFDENYPFIPKDEVRSFQWNNGQATIHPSVINLKDAGNTLGHNGYVVTSDCMSHDTAAAHLYKQCLEQFMRRKFQIKPNGICYFSDGSAAQYKNRKNFICLCFCEDLESMLNGNIP
jgi:hypothetical protein